jgi:chromosome segregation ATPase
MLINENHNLREQLEQETERTKAHKRSAPPDDDQTESLVNVLEELIESFKNIEMKYESEINQLQQTLEATRSDLEDKLKKLNQQLDSKINTIEALTIQIKRKDEILENISAKFSKIEQEAQQRPPSMFKSNNRLSDNQGEIKALEKKI